jgi:putative ABC transport system permease protein
MVRFAWRNLLSRPVRSLLAWLGLTVAIMGMVGLFSISAGMQRTIDGTFGRFTGLAAMQPGAPIPILSRIPAAWADEIAAMPGVRTVCREVWFRAHLVDGKSTYNPPRFLFGTDVLHMNQLPRATYRDDIVAGRFFAADEWGRPQTVISRQIADEHHKQVGDTLRVDGYDLTVLGIYETNSLFLDLAIIVDGDMARKIAVQDRGVLSSMYIEPDGTIPNEELVEQIRARFRGRGGAASLANLTPSTGNAFADFAISAITRLSQSPAAPKSTVEAAAEEDGLEVRAAVDFGENVEDISADLNLFLFLINIIGVAIALLSILNTMLMSVTERLVEFGVLRANGWSRANVMRLIVAESALLGCGGGLSGCLVGWAGTLLVNWWLPSKANLYAGPSLLLWSLLFSTALGMLGGLYPAWWAVQRSPMDAIRRG